MSSMISPDRLSDIPEEDPSMLEDVSQAEQEVWKRLSGLSANVRTSVRGALASRTADEARTQYEDLPADRQRAYREDEGRRRAIRTTISEETLRGFESMHFVAKMQVSSALEDHTMYFNLASKREERKSWTQTEVRNWLNSAATADGLKDTIAIPDLPSGKTLADVTFTPAQKDAIAAKYIEQLKQYKDIQQIVSAGGVHEANVRTALLLAQDHPAEVAEVLQGASVGASEGVRLLEAQRNVLASIDHLSRMQMDGDAMNDRDIGQELQHLSHDRENIRTGQLAQSIESNYLQSIVGGGATTFSAARITPVNSGQYLAQLAERMRGAEKAQHFYGEVSQVLRTIRQQAERAGLSLGATLNGYVNATGLIPGTLDHSFTPKLIADSIKAEFNLPEVADLDAQIREKRAEVGKKGRDKLTGMEAVLAIYEKHFELQGSTRPRDAARELFARNEVGRQEVQESLRTANRKEVFGEQDGVVDWGARQMKQLATGSQETYMANLGQALGLGRNEGTGSLSLIRGTRRLWSPWAKFGARPAWGAMDYPQLLTSYYALRSAVQEGHLNNSSYVRQQRDEIIRLLSSKFMKKFVTDFDANTLMASGEDDTRKDVTDQLRKRVQNALRNLYAGEAPEPYGADAKAAVEEAAKNTARIRRFVGRTTKKLAVGTLNATLGAAIGRGSAKNPISWPAKTIKGTAKLGVSALKSFWAWGMEPAKVFG